MSNTSDLFPDQVIPTGIPGKVNLDAYYNNKSRSVPQAPSPEIRAYWSGSPAPLRFVLAPFGANDPVNSPVYRPDNPVGFGLITSRALWKSPTLDLRPDLKGSSSYQPEARPIMRGSDYGRGARLLLTTTGLTALAPGGAPGAQRGFAVYSVEFGAVDNPRNMRALNARQNITSHFYDPILSGGVAPSPIGPPGLQNFPDTASLLNFEPPGHPIRYWSVAVIFECHSAGAPPGVPGQIPLVCQGEVT